MYESSRSSFVADAQEMRQHFPKETLTAIATQYEDWYERVQNLESTYGHTSALSTWEDVLPLSEFGLRRDATSSSIVYFDESGAKVLSITPEGLIEPSEALTDANFYMNPNPFYVDSELSKAPETEEFAILGDMAAAAFDDLVAKRPFVVFDNKVEYAKCLNRYFVSMQTIEREMDDFYHAYKAAFDGTNERDAIKDVVSSFTDETTEIMSDMANHYEDLLKSDVTEADLAEVRSQMEKELAALAADTHSEIEKIGENSPSSIDDVWVTDSINMMGENRREFFKSENPIYLAAIDAEKCGEACFDTQGIVLGYDPKTLELVDLEIDGKSYVGTRLFSELRAQAMEERETTLATRDAEVRESQKNRAEIFGEMQDRIQSLGINAEVLDLERI